MNFRLSMLIAIGPPVGVTRNGSLRTIARPNRQVCGLLHSPIMLQCIESGFDVVDGARSRHRSAIGWFVRDESHEGSRPHANYHNRFGYRQERVPGSRDRRQREDCCSEAAAARSGAGVLQSVATLPGRHRGVRHGMWREKVDQHNTGNPVYERIERVIVERPPQSNDVRSSLSERRNETEHEISYEEPATIVQATPTLVRVISMPTLRIPTAPVFRPLLEPARYKGAYGGRGSGKSHFFGELMVEECLTTPGTLAVCIREVQKSLMQSSKRLIESKIHQLGVGISSKSCMTASLRPAMA